MAKQVKQSKVTNIQSTHGRGASIEHQESYDDSLLPDANELIRLKEIDPLIIDWIKERTAKEQDSRHDFNDRKMSLLEKSHSRTYSIDIITILCALIIILSGMLFSYFLFNKEQPVIGTIFAGGTILLAANAFLDFRKKRTQNK